MTPTNLSVDSARRLAELATVRSGPRRATRSVLAADSANGTAIQLWDCFGGVNQVWRLPA